MGYSSIEENFVKNNNKKKQDSNEVGYVPPRQLVLKYLPPKTKIVLLNGTNKVALL